MDGNRGLKRKLDPSQDPDYEFDHDQKRKKSEDDEAKSFCSEDEWKKLTKAREIIDRNFTLELQRRESEIENLDSMILQVQKSLHLIRYAVVSNLFSGPNIVGQDISIHPTTRKLLRGKKPKLGSEVELAKKVSSSEISSLKNPITDKLEPNIIPSYIEPSSDPSKPEIEPRGLQYKRKRRIVIGNVSRWIECDQREDLATHKWMLYVRGCKDEPDVSDVVAKVRFLIHESYHPNNLIEVTRPPFHLTRRGWGEFPARIQIHFKNDCDKPIDIVHNLKLDKTYTGLQTLGAETIVDVWLHKNVTANAGKTDITLFSRAAASDVRAKQASAIKSESTPHKSKLKPEIKVEAETTASKKPYVTNDFDVQTTFIRCKDKEGGSFFLPVAVLPKNCQKKVDWNQTSVSPLKAHRQPPEHVRLSVEHIIPHQQQPKKSKSHISNGQTDPTNFSDRFNNSLLKSLAVPAGTSLLRSRVSPSKPETLTLSWSSVLAGRQKISLKDFEKRISKIDSSFLHKGIEYIHLLREKLLSFDPSDFSDTESYFLTLGRYFPLVSSLSKESSLYRTLLPFSAKSEAEFQSWSLTKQKASEWMRAKTIQKIVNTLRGPQKTTKELVIFFRDYGFSYIRRRESSKVHCPDFENFSTVSPYSAQSLTKPRSGPHLNSNDSNDEIVVDDDDDLPPTRRNSSNMKPENCSAAKIGRLILTDDNIDAMSFVDGAVKQLGFKLDIEEIHPGVVYPLAQKLLFSACKNFMEELIRRGHAESVRDSDDPATVNLSHLVRAIVNSKRFDFLTNSGLADPESYQN